MKSIVIEYQKIEKNSLWKNISFLSTALISTSKCKLCYFDKVIFCFTPLICVIRINQINEVSYQLKHHSSHAYLVCL